MTRPASLTRNNLTPLIQGRGPVSATELAALLRVSRSTVARALPDFGEELVTLGTTRSTRYLLRRQVRNIGNRWPIHRIDPHGRATEWAELEALHDRHWRIHWAGDPPAWAGLFMETNGLWSGFPFFLSDIRPQGFLGRTIARQLSTTLQVPDDPRSWTDEDTLVYLQAAGDDLPGNLLVGNACLRRTLARSADLPGGETAISDAQRATFYAQQAVHVTQSLPGSSAGGEQPKFLTTLVDAAGDFQAVIIKFSAPINQATAQRWADLLLCEFHAHHVLAQAGLSNSATRLLDAGDRRFLEVPRFDRNGRSGRHGIVSLEMLSTALTGLLTRDWTAATSALQALGLIHPDALANIHRLHAFGELIGNSDMHLGNLAFFLTDDLPFHSAPAYDMLPMLWAPGPQGEIVDRSFAPLPPLPAMTDTWREAAQWAEEFWTRVTNDPRISAGFRSITQNAAETVRRLRRHVG